MFLNQKYLIYNKPLHFYVFFKIEKKNQIMKVLKTHLICDTSHDGERQQKK